MRKLAVGVALAGLAAAGTASIIERAPSAAPLRDGAAKCSPGKHAGMAFRRQHKLTVAGKIVSDPVRLKRGVWLRTQEDGIAFFCLKRGGTTCEVGLESVLQIEPPKQKGVLLYLTASLGGVSCVTKFKGGRFIDTPGERLTFDDPVFSIAVGKRKTIVKVRRGTTVVSRRGRPRKGVVVGRQQQVVVPAGRDPKRPTPIKTSPAERRILDQLERTLPALVPKPPPEAQFLKRPPDPSSSRTASFTFSPQGATFSCALDGTDFRYCTREQDFPGLEFGRHTLRIRATDAEGNAGPVDSYFWTVLPAAATAITFASDRDGDFEVYLLSPDGGGVVALTHNGARDDDPAWSPDRTRIAFHSERDGNSEIYVMNADGTGVRPLTTDPAIDRNPAWSPDGSQIVFESYRDGNREIYVMNADGTGQVNLSRNQAEELDPAWSPAGRIAFASNRDGNREIYVMNADGSGQTRRTRTPASEYNPAWSRDGGQLAFHSDRDGNYEIYVTDADGRIEIALSKSPAGDFNPSWSPDGERIAFESDRDGNREIYVMNADGSGQRRLTKSAAVDQVPDW